MFLAEPQRTNYDLNFVLFGIPVRIHPFFWLISLLLGARPNEGEPVGVLIWVGVIFISILVHELGHALTARAHGWPPQITLHGFGGLASYRPTYHSTKSQLLITAAGPAAGLLLAFFVVGLVFAARGQVDFSLGGPIGFFWEVQGIKNIRVFQMVHALLYINIFWSLINLFPVYPLDGGQIAREILVHFNNPQEGVILSLKLSIITAVGLAVFAVFKLEMFFMAFLFGYLAYSSFQTLQAYTGRGGGHGGPW